MAQHQPLLVRRRTVLFVISLLASTAALASAPSAELMERNSEVCRGLQPYLEVAKRIAVRDPDLLNLFLKARVHAFECHARLQGWELVDTRPLRAIPFSEARWPALNLGNVGGVKRAIRQQRCSQRLQMPPLRTPSLQTQRCS